MRISHPDRRKLNRKLRIAAGMHNIALRQKSKASLFAVLLFCLLFALPCFAAQSETVDIPVHISGGGTVVITPAVNCPAPQTSTLEIADGEEGHVLLTFRQPGVYSYTVSPKNSEQYQPGSYLVLITVTTEEDGSLKAVITLGRDDTGEKTEELHFEPKQPPAEPPTKTTRPPEPPTEPDKPDNPRTGDDSNLYSYVAYAILASAGLFLLSLIYYAQTKRLISGAQDEMK